MATCRDLISEAVTAFGGIAPGDGLTVDEINVGLTAIQREIRRVHEMRGPLTGVDVTANYTAGPNERVRVQSGYTISLTLPNSVDITASASRQNDYNFALSYDTPAGSALSADGLVRRAPRDGDRIEIVGTTHGLYFYRSDTNEWVECGSLTIDGSMPLNESYLSDFAAIIAVRLCKSWPSVTQIIPSAQMLREEGRANLRLSYRHGVERDQVQAQYF